MTIQLANKSAQEYKEYFRWYKSGFNGGGTELIEATLHDYGRVRSFTVNPNKPGINYTVGDVITFEQTEGDDREPIQMVVAEVGWNGSPKKLVLSNRGWFYKGGTETPENRPATGGTGSNLEVTFLIESNADVDITDGGSGFPTFENDLYGFGIFVPQAEDDLQVQPAQRQNPGSIQTFNIYYNGEAQLTFPTNQGWFTVEPLVEVWQGEYYVGGPDGPNFHMSWWCTAEGREHRLSRIWQDIQQMTVTNKTLTDYMEYALANLTDYKPITI